VNMLMNLRVPQNAENFLTVCGRFSLSRMTLVHRISLLVTCLTIPQMILSVGSPHDCFLAGRYGIC
jgi:hypothetical protein